MWYSILPESLTELESWIARFFVRTRTRAPSTAAKYNPKLF